MVTDYLPDEMEICYFEIDSPFTCLKLDGSKLIITGVEDDIVEPSCEEWMAFWEKLEEIGLWNIQEDYDRCCMGDGYSWEIRISHNGNNIDSTGMNDGPTHVVGGEIVSALEEFFEALEDLCGVELGIGF